MLINDGLRVVVVVTRKGIKVRKYEGENPIKKALESLEEDR